MNNLNHIAFIMDGNEDGASKKKEVEIMGMLLVLKLCKKLWKRQFFLNFQLLHFMFFQQKIGKDQKQK